jgi:mercuric ion binding protein
MKTSINYFAIVLLLLTTVSVFAGTPAKPKTEVVTIQTSAVCEACKDRIEKALKSTDGIISANLDLKDKKIKVKYNPDKTAPDQIRTVIANTGYDADGVKKNTEAFTRLPKCCQKEGGACEHKM